MTPNFDAPGQAVARVDLTIDVPSTVACAYHRTAGPAIYLSDDAGRSIMILIDERFVERLTHLQRELRTMLARVVPPGQPRA